MRDHLRAHFGYLSAHLPGGSVSDDGVLLITDSGLDCDTFNTVIAGSLTEQEAERNVRAAVERFSGRAFSWWHGPNSPAFLPVLLERCGVFANEQEVAMVLDCNAAPVDLLMPAGLVISCVETLGALADYAAVIAANWSPPDPDVLAFYNGTADAALSPTSPLTLFIGYMEGEPVGTAELALGADGVAGIYSVATLSARRGIGIGSSLTAAAITVGRLNGARAIELQASEDGANIYRRLGFQPSGTWTEYKPRM